MANFQSLKIISFFNFALIILLFFCLTKRKVTKEKGPFFEMLRTKKDRYTLKCGGKLLKVTLVGGAMI